MNKIKKLELTPLETPPYLIQDFVSLEGEGGTVGRSALYIRTNQCSLRCSFCDTSFSVEGKSEHNIVDMTSHKFTKYLDDKYTDEQQLNITNLSITGGEPLLHINNLSDIIDRTLESFPYITSIIIETNGTMLSSKENCFALIEQIGKYHGILNIMLSISPKLSARTSYSNIITDEEILTLYDKVLINYNNILKGNFDIQLKFIYSLKLADENYNLLELVNREHSISKSKILMMPFTPPEPLGRDKQEWHISKNITAQFAMDNFYRYSPRVHIDRELD